ncbi:peptidoglycan-binding protein, partial [Streptomyces sp. IB2014 016-6]
GGGGCTVPGNADPEVLKAVYRKAVELGVDDRVLLAGFEAGVVESNMNNLDCGDRDSLGVFQQRPSQGWGTPEQIMDVAYASNSFFTRAVDVAQSHPDYSAGQVAQAVQISAYPDRYDAVEVTARALIEQARDLVGQAVS